MGNTIDKRELRVIEHDFNSIANRLLQSTLDDFPHNLALFMKHIDNIELIHDFIVSCGELPGNIDEITKEVAASYGRRFFDFGDNEQSEVTGIYALLQHMNHKGEAKITGIIMGYGRGNNAYDNKLRDFNSRVTAILINYISDYLVRIGIRMGMDESRQYIITVGDGGQVNIAEDNATVNATQNNGIDDAQLQKLLKAIKDNAIDLSEEDREELFENIEVIETEASSAKPKKSIFKTAVKGLNGIKERFPQMIELGAAIAELAGFVMEHVIPRIP